MATTNIRAYVIRAIDYGETSKILTLYTENKGIISIMARGVKSPKSKKFNLVSLFTEAEFELSERNDFYFLKDGSIINSNFHIRENIKKIYLTQMFFDIIERTVVKNEEDTNIFKLLNKTIEYLEKTDDLILIANMFLIKYISMIGFRPRLNQCAKCGTTELKRIYFSQSLGGVVCENDRTPDSNLLSIAEFKYLNRVLLEIFENIGIISIDINQAKIFKLIIEFIRYNTDITMSKSYMNFIRFMGID